MLESALPMTYVDELRECGIILQAGGRSVSEVVLTNRCLRCLGTRFLDLFYKWDP